MTKPNAKTFKVQFTIANRYTIDAAVVDEMRAKGYQPIIGSAPMCYDVEGMMPLVRQSIRNEKDDKKLTFLLEEYSKFQLAKSLGIKTLPIVKEIRIKRFEDMPKHLLKKEVN